MNFVEIFGLGGAFWAIIALVLLFWAWRLARRERYVEHKRLMIFLTLVAWLFLLIYILKTAVFNVEPVHVPDHLVPWIAIHGTLGLIPALATPIILWSRLTGSGFLKGFHRHLNGHHGHYGRIVVAVWALTHVGGVINFLLFY